MKILILTQYFPPEFGAAATRNSEHARFWAEAGHEVEVCTGMPNYPAGVIHEAYRGKWHVLEEKDGYVVHRAWIYATPNRTVWRRALASLSFLASGLLCGIFKCRRPDVVIASSGPFFVGPLGWILSVFKRAAFVFEVRDLLPQQAIDIGMIRNPAAIAFLKAVEAFLYRRARRIVAVAPASARLLAERGFDAAKIVTIENAICSDFFVPAERENAIRKQYGWQGRFIAMYIGAHGVSQGLFTLLETAERVADLEDILFVFVGDGADKPRMIEWAQSHGLRNVEFLPLQDKERMPAFYAAADVCFVPLRKGDYFRINIPSKIFEIMACARPVILGAEGQALDILEQANAGIPVAPEDPDAFADAVRRLHADRALADSLGVSGRAYVIEHFDRRRKAASYIEALKGI